MFGFVTRTEGIKIHRMSCPNAARLIDMYPYRIQKVKWSETPSSGNFQTGLRVIAALEASVINEIMDIVNSFRASLRMFNVSENDRQGTYDINMKIAVPSNLELDKVISQIRNLKNVIKINRIYCPFTAFIPCLKVTFSAFTDSTDSLVFKNAKKNNMIANTEKIVMV